MKLFFKRYYLPLLILAVALLYPDSFISPFFQDDRFYLGLSFPVDLFRPIPPTHFHPISNQLFYMVGEFLFQRQVWGFHLILFSLFVISVYLVNSLAQNLLGSRRKALLATTFYALNLSLFANFFWIATSYFVIGGTFAFATVWAYLSQNKYRSLLSTLFFLAAFLSNELTLVVPGLCLLTDWYRGRRSKLGYGLLLLSGGLFLLRLLLVDRPNSADYSLQVAPVFATLRWYLLRVANLPEGIRFAANPILYPMFFALLTTFVWALVSPLNLSARRLRVFLLGFLWFLLGALPFYFLPNHLSSYYLTIALLGPALIVGEVFRSKVTWLIFFALFFLLTVNGLAFLRQTHWIILKNTGPIGQF